MSPAVLPSTVGVTIRQFDGSNPFTLHAAFTFTGDPESGFDPVLFPVFTPPVRGVNGSEFHTVVRVWDKGQPPYAARTLPLYGVERSCLLVSPVLTPLDPILLNDREWVPPTDCSQSVGRVLWVPKGEADHLAGSIRITDVTRQATSHGVEVPVVRRDDFVEDRLVFMGVPADSRYRSRLRIYSLYRGEILLNLNVNGVGHQVYLRPGANMFEPSYLEFTSFPSLGDLPIGETTFRVVVDTARGPDGVLIPGTPIWGFISVTNNETQQITTITPN